MYLTIKSKKGKKKLSYANLAICDKIIWDKYELNVNEMKQNFDLTKHAPKKKEKGSMGAEFYASIRW